MPVRTPEGGSSDDDLNNALFQPVVDEADSWIPNLKGPHVEEDPTTIEEDLISEDDPIFEEDPISEEDTMVEERDDEASGQESEVEELDEEQAFWNVKQEKLHFRKLGAEVFSDLDSEEEFDNVGYTEQIQTDLEEVAKNLSLWRRFGYEMDRQPEQRLLVEEYLQMRKKEDLDAIHHLVQLGYSGVLVFPTTEIYEAFSANVSCYPEFNFIILSNLTSFKLNTGARIPSVGLQTCCCAPGLVGSMVDYAVKAGYRHIDCAPSNQNEKEIGDALKRLFDEGVVKREDLFISSKLWCTDHAPEDVHGALSKTLEDLQISYLDLYLIHWPVRMAKDSAGCAPENFLPSDLASTWNAMETLMDSKKTLAIGVSNFSMKKLADLVKVASIIPAVIQVECHPSWEQSELHQFCEGHEIHLSAYAPLGSPGLTSTWLSCKVLDNSVLLQIAKKLDKSAAQVALRWGLQMGHSVLSHSTDDSRIKKNFDILDWELEEPLFDGHFEQARLHEGAEFVHETLGEYKNVNMLWDGEI